MEINRLRCRVNYHPRRGGSGTGDGAGAHRWRLHSGMAAPGLEDGDDGTRGRRCHDSGAAMGLGDGAASGSRGGGRRRGGGRASGTVAGIGGARQTGLERARQDEIWGAGWEKREEGKGRKGWSFVLYNLITAGW